MLSWEGLEILAGAETLSEQVLERLTVRLVPVPNIEALATTMVGVARDVP